MIMRNHFRVVTLVVAAVVLGSMSGIHAASLLSVTGGSGTDIWQAEPGQSIPTGTAGTLNGALSVTGGVYIFTFGGFDQNWLPLLGGQTGDANANFLNQFWVGSSYSAAQQSGQVFCNHAAAACGGLATPVGTQFSVDLPAGLVPFGFTFGPTANNLILNGQTNNNAAGAYLVQIGTGTTVSTSPGTIAYLGLTDSAYPGDRDFQDLVVTVTATPEPNSMLLIGTGLLAVGFYFRRRNNNGAQG